MSTNIFSGTLFGIAALLLALTSAFASDIAASQENRSELSPRQQQVIRSVFSRLDSGEEHKMAMEWSDAKKVSETMCRPIALQYFKKQYPQADRIFLGNRGNDSLELQRNKRLTGTGQFREGTNWHYFTFECQLNPATGRTTSFTANITKTESFRYQSF